MVKEFLKKLYDVYDNDYKNSNDKLEKVKEAILENEKFIELLRSESQNVFSDFSPREYTNKNNSKITETERTQDALMESRDALTEHIASVSNMKSQITQSLEEIKELEMNARDSQWFESNVYNAGNSEEDPVVGTSSHMDQETAAKLEDILSYLLADPLRAKHELQKLL